MTKHNSEIPATERWQIFQETYGNQVDPANSLEPIILEIGHLLQQILGDAANDGMALMLRRSGICESEDDWQEQLSENAGFLFSETRLGKRLHDLTAYALFGIFTPSIPDKNREAELGLLIAEATQFLRGFSITVPSMEPLDTSELELVVMLANNRWALDHENPLDPAAVAYFGGVSEGRVRNLMAGSNRQFSTVDGKIPALEALAWLCDRKTFWPSAWADHPDLMASSIVDDAEYDSPVFVPVASDDSIFHPGLTRKGEYQVGAKHNETIVADFDTAIAQLQSMATPRWRRPNDKGHWGIVTGVRWARVSKDTLEQANQGELFRLPRLH